MLAKIWSSFADLSMQRKLAIVFVFLVSIPIIATSLISYRNYSESIKRNTEKLVIEAAGKTLEKLDQYISDLKRISTMPYYFEDMLQLLSDAGMSVDKQRQLDFYITSLNNIKKDTSSVYLFDNYGRLFYNIKTDGIRTDIHERIKEWLPMARRAEGRPVLIPTRQTPSSNKAEYVFSLVRELNDPDLLDPVGLIVFDTKAEILERALSQLDEATGGESWLVDGQHRVIYAADSAWIGRKAPHPLTRIPESGDSGSFAAEMDHERYILTYTTSQTTGWKLVTTLPVRLLIKDAAVTRNVTLLVTVLILGFALFISIAISHALTRPLKRMTRLMKEVQKGDLSVAVETKHNDEIGMLGAHFNGMLIRIRELLEEVYFTRIRKKEAELIALQSQINPHFIYNTLETIRMTALINDDDEVSEMTLILGKLLRYSINRGNEIVSLREEIEHLSNYVYLQNRRFSDRFQLVLRIPESLYEYRVLKLMFQPIVENAIFHGLEHTEGTQPIEVKGSHEGHHLIFAITDRGSGMDPATLNHLRISLNTIGHRDSRYGIGLRNVNERIKLHYGDRYGLDVESKPGEGTVVKLRLPYTDHNKPGG